jgi:hypothetical protein
LKEGMTLGEVPSHYMWGNAQGVTLGKVLRHYMWGDAQRVGKSRNKHHFPEINIPPKSSLFQECSKGTSRKLLLVCSCDMPSKYTGKKQYKSKMVSNALSFTEKKFHWVMCPPDTLEIFFGCFMWICSCSSLQFATL